MILKHLIEIFGWCLESQKKLNVDILMMFDHLQILDGTNPVSDNNIIFVLSFSSIFSFSLSKNI